MHNINLKFVAYDVGDKQLIVMNDMEWMQRNWVQGHYYEELLLEYIKDNYKGDTFVDVGACIGNHSVFFSSIADDVVSFEPLKENFYHLTLNLKLNGIKNVDFYNFGLGYKEELTTLWYDSAQKNSGNSTMEGKLPETDSARFVPVIQMDSLEINNVKLIKIDVEGYEVEVLKGAIKTIEMFHPDMFIECSTQAEYDKVFAFLKPLGYLKPDLVFNGTPTYLFSTEPKELFSKKKEVAK